MSRLPRALSFAVVLLLGFAASAGLSVFAVPAPRAPRVIAIGLTRADTPLCQSDPNELALYRLGVGGALPFRVTGSGCPAPGTELEVGDRLISRIPGIALRLRCNPSPDLATGTDFSLPHPFNVMIDEGQECTVQLDTGALEGVSEQPTDVKGLVNLGTHGTHYRTEVVRDRSGLHQKLIVYEGTVFDAANRAWQVDAGTKTVIPPRGAPTRIETVAAVDRERTSDLLARLDVSALRIENRATAFTQLRASHLAVLSQPNDAAARADLAVRLANYAPTQAAYQIRRAGTERLTPVVQANLLLASGLTKNALGNPGSGQQDLERAQRADPTVLTRAVREFNLDANRFTMISKFNRVIPPILASAAVQPPTASPGTPVRIVVRATAGGAPLPGATVTVEAGGGRFAPGGGLSSSGPTDANGGFSTTWSCQPCAPGYVFSVRVEKQGYAGAKTEATVRLGR